MGLVSTQYNLVNPIVFLCNGMPEEKIIAGPRPTI